MNIIHSDQKLPDITYNESGVDQMNGIFLAGPTPRSSKIESWRKEAIKIFEDKGFNGTLLIPEKKDWTVKFEYKDQVEWEYEALLRSKVIMFWIPRSLPDMPGFTTNVEFGYWIKEYPYKNIIYGRPDDSEKNRYLDWIYKKETGLDIYNNLEKTIAISIWFLYE